MRRLVELTGLGLFQGKEHPGIVVPVRAGDAVLLFSGVAVEINNAKGNQAGVKD